MASQPDTISDANSSKQLLLQIQQIIPIAIEKSRAASASVGRWKTITFKLEQILPCISDLSNHPCFAKNTLCIELLHSVISALNDAIKLANQCCSSVPANQGKLQLQSDLNSLLGKLDLSLHDGSLLVKTGVLSDTVMNSTANSSALVSTQCSVRELLARLQIGHAEAKHQALSSLHEVMKENDKSVFSALTRTNLFAVIQLLGATNLKTREKAAAVICILAESGSCENLLTVSEEVLPPLIRLLDSGSLIAREKAVMALERLSMFSDAARSIVGHGGIGPLIELSKIGDSICQLAAAGTLKNLSVIPEVRQTLAEEGIIRAMISLLKCGGGVLGCKEYAAECLQNLTASNDSLKKSVVAEGGLKSLLAYIDGPLPQEPAVAAVKNLIPVVPFDQLISIGLLPRLIHVLKNGSLGAQHAAAATICRISHSADTKKLFGELGCIPLLAKMLEAKANQTREVAAQAIAILLSYPQNSKQVKRDDKFVLKLVVLLDPSPQNTAKKYAVTCLLCMSTSKRCRKLMISHGAVGHLKKLCENDVTGAKKLLERLEKPKFKRLFKIRK